MSQGTRRIWPQEIDDLIIDCYSKELYPVVILKKHPLTRDIPSDTIKKRAYSLGCRVRTNKRYTPEEESRILELSETRTPAQIAKTLSSRGGRRRTVRAVKHFLLSQPDRIRPDLYTITDIMIGFHCTNKKVRTWIEKGLLRAHRNKGEGTTWHIKPVHVARFIYNHPYELETCRPDIPWLVALIFEFRSSLLRVRCKDNTNLDNDVSQEGEINEDQYTQSQTEDVYS